LQRIHDALTLAQELSHPFSLIYALSFAAMLHQYRREEQLTQERAEAVIRLCTDRGSLTWLGLSTIWWGWALNEQGQREEGLAQMHQGFAITQATGIELGRSRNLALLAEAYGKVGQVEEGLAVLAEALALVDRTREQFYEAELYRLKGELTLQQESQKSKVKKQKSKVKSPKTQIPKPKSQLPHWSGSGGVFSQSY
jgi:predicted ATPase